MIPGAPKDGDLLVSKTYPHITFLIVLGHDSVLYRKRIDLVGVEGMYAEIPKDFSSYGEGYYLAGNIYEVIKRALQ